MWFREKNTIAATIPLTYKNCTQSLQYPENNIKVHLYKYFLCVIKDCQDFFYREGFLIVYIVYIYKYQSYNSQDFWYGE